MRAISTTLRDAQLDAAIRRAHSLRLERDTMRVTENVYSISPTVDTNIAQCYAMEGGSYYCTFRGVDGASYAAVSSNGALSTAAATQIAAFSSPSPLRSGMAHTPGFKPTIYSSLVSGTTFQLRKAQFASNANPPTLSWSDFGPTFGEKLHSSLVVKRVEAVCPLTDGRVIVATGEHRFDTGASCITFWLITASAAVQLNTSITLDLSESYTNYLAVATYCSYVTAFLDPDGTILVAANSGQLTGSSARAVIFSLRNGVESSLMDLVPVDPEASALGVLPCSFSTINRVPYLTVRVTRTFGDGSSAGSLGYDGYCVGGPDGRFSFGAKQHWLCSEIRIGALLDAGDNAHARYVGNGSALTLEITPSQLPTATVGGEALDGKVLGWKVHMISDGADAFDAELQNADGALASDLLLASGSIVKLTSGISNDLAPIGVYGIDRVEHSISPSGWGAAGIQGRDLGRKTLSDYQFPFSGQMLGRSSARSSPAALDRLILKSPDRGFGQGAGGLAVTGLNEPLIAMWEAHDHGHSLTKLTAKFTVNDPYHLGSVGVIIGATEDGRGSLFAIPKANSWAGHTMPRPRWRTLDLVDVDPNNPEAINTGWNWEAAANALIAAKDAADSRTTDPGATYSTDTDFTVTVDQETDVAVRVFGRRAYLWTKRRLMSPSQCAQYSAYALRTVVDLGGAARARHGRHTLCGIAASNDAWFDKTAFAQATYSDIEQGLSDAGNTVDFSHLVTTNAEVENRDDYQLFTADTNLFVVGQWIRVQVIGGSSQICRIVSINPGLWMVTDPWLGNPGNWGDHWAAYIYSQASGTEWGWAGSGYTEFPAPDGSTQVNDRKAVKRGRVIGGRAAFASNDNTAMTLRYIETDGVRHALRSGSLIGGGAGGTGMGWDFTNPIAPPGLGANSSTPNVWRIVFHHGKLFQGGAVSQGLPANGYVVCDDEIIRYADATFKLRGEFSDETWCVIPTYYLPLAAAAAGSVTLPQWNSGANYPGDNPADIPNIAGLLVEITSRNQGQDEQDAQYYAASAAAHQLTLSAAYPNAVRALESVAVVSGRGQFGTAKTKHAADAVVAYCPVDSQGNRASVIVSRAGFWSGRYQCVQDAIDSVSKLAGLRSSAFRFSHLAPSSAFTATLADASVSIPARTLLADFVLELNAYVPKVSNSWLTVAFRDYYVLRLAQRTAGTLSLQLNTTKDSASGGIDAYGGVRTLEAVDIPMGALDISSSTASRNNLRIVAMGTEIIVELEGQPIWTFDLDAMTDGTHSYSVATAAAVTIGYTGTGTSLNLTANLVELADEVGDVFIRSDQSALAVIGDVLQDKPIANRATPTGGVEWSQWWTRDDAGAISTKIVSDTWRLSDQQGAGHLQISGDGAAGEILDAATLNVSGYRFDASQSDSARTADMAKAEARLALRMQREYADQRGLDTLGFVQLQPEDKLSISHKWQTLATYVITDVELASDQAAVRASVGARRFVEP